MDRAYCDKLNKYICSSELKDIDNPGMLVFKCSENCDALLTPCCWDNNRIFKKDPYFKTKGAIIHNENCPHLKIDVPKYCKSNDKTIKQTHIKKVLNNNVNVRFRNNEKNDYKSNQTLSNEEKGNTRYNTVGQVNVNHELRENSKDMFFDVMCDKFFKYNENNNFFISLDNNVLNKKYDAKYVIFYGEIMNIHEVPSYNYFNINFKDNFQISFRYKDDKNLSELRKKFTKGSTLYYYAEKFAFQSKLKHKFVNDPTLDKIYIL